MPSLRNDRGMALPMALGFMLVISIALVTVLEFSSAGQRSSNFSKTDQVALTVAESALNQAHSVLVNSNIHTLSSALPATCDDSPTVYAEGGTACYWGTLSANIWTVHARATLPNPSSGGSPVTHEVSQQMAVAPPVGTTADNPAWNYMYSDSPTGCMIIQSSVTIEQKVYVKNDLCLDSSARILASAGEVSVGGEITTNSSAWIGPGTSLPVLNLGSTSTGCKKGGYTGGGAGYAYPCTAGTHQVNATTQNHTVPSVTKPPINLAYWYTNAQPGPTHLCTSSTGTPPTFDNNTSMDNTSPTISLIGSGYSCSVTGGGSISWVPGSPGTLTVDGAIFFDGDIVMNSSTKARVVGRGTIYTSGRILMDGSTQICSVFSSGNCSTSGWDPDVSMLTLVAGSGTPGLPSDTYAITLNSSVRWQGGLYAVGDYLQTSSVIAQGPVIAKQIYYDSSTGSVSAPFDTMAPGSPGNPTTSTVTAVPGSWRG